MSRQGAPRLQASRPEPVITYSLVADDSRSAGDDNRFAGNGERTEPRLATPRAPRFEEVAAPLPFDGLPSEPAVPRAANDRDERPRSAFARVVVVVGILALLAGVGVLAVTYSGAVRPSVSVVGAPAGGDTMPPGALDLPEANVRVLSSPAEQTTTVVREPPATAAETATAAPAEQPAAAPPIPSPRPTMDAAAPAPRQETAATVPPPAPAGTSVAPLATNGDVDSLMSSVDQILAAEKARAASGAAATPTADDGPAMDSVGEAPTLDPFAPAPAMDPSTGFAPEAPPPAPPRRLFFDTASDGGPIPPADIPNVSPRYSGW